MGWSQDRAINVHSIYRTLGLDWDLDLRFYDKQYLGRNDECMINCHTSHKFMVVVVAIMYRSTKEKRHKIQLKCSSITYYCWGYWPSALQNPGWRYCWSFRAHQAARPGLATPISSRPGPVLQFPEFDALQCCSLAKPTAAGKNMEKSLKHRLLTLI